MFRFAVAGRGEVGGLRRSAPRRGRPGFSRRSGGWLGKVFELAPQPDDGNSGVAQAGQVAQQVANPSAAAAFMPALTRSLIGEDSSSAMAAMIVNMARPMGLAVSTWS